MFRSQFRSQLSSGLAAVAYVLALPGTGIPAAAGQSASQAAQSRDTNRASISPATGSMQTVVVVTGKLDLGKITIADFGDVEPAKR